MQGTTEEQLEASRSQYEEHKRNFEQWKIDNSKQKGTPSYEKYVADFHQWESEMVKTIQRMEMTRVDNQLDKLLDEVTKQEFCHALSKMSAHDKTFSSNLMNNYKRIMTTPGDTRTIRQSAAPVVQMAALSHPHYVPNLQGATWTPAAPVKFRVPSPVSSYKNPNLFKINRSQRFYSPSMATKIMSLSESVRGMTQLDTEKFRKTITFPVLRVKSHDLNKIRGKVRLEKYLLKNLNNIKNVMDSEEETIKFLVFDPDVVNEEDLELKNTIIEQVKQVVEATPTWDNRVMDITFDNWDHRTIFRAILPDGLDFSSFTQTGHIIHCNFRDDLTPYKQIIGEVLLKKVKKCSTVVNKVDKISAEYRNFELELIAGEENYTTSVTERGITYFMDFSKVFWNSRLQHEHERVIQLLTKDSLVFDACAGIGPFVLPAAKQKRCKVVYANDLNPESIKWMNKNIEANKIVANQITTFNMDANDFIKGPVAKEIAKELSRPCDEDIQKIQGAHVLMNLPAFSVNFLPSFKGFLKDHLIVAPKSAAEFPVWVYSYLFVKWYVDRAIEMVKEKLGWTGDSCNTRIEVHHVRTVSTRKEMFCLRIDLPLGYLMDASISGLDEPPNKKQKV